MYYVTVTSNCTIPNLYNLKTSPFLHAKNNLISTDLNPSSFIGPYPILMRSKAGHVFFVWWFLFNGKTHGNLLPNVSPPFGDDSFGICLVDLFLKKPPGESFQSIAGYILWRLFFTDLQDASLCSCKYLHFGQSFIRWCRSWFALGTLRLGVKEITAELAWGQEHGGIVLWLAKLCLLVFGVGVWHKVSNSKTTTVWQGICKYTQLIRLFFKRIWGWWKVWYCKLSQYHGSLS